MTFFPKTWVRKSVLNILFFLDFCVIWILVSNVGSDLIGGDTERDGGGGDGGDDGDDGNSESIVVVVVVIVFIPIISVLVILIIIYMSLQLYL